MRSKMEHEVLVWEMGLRCSETEPFAARVQQSKKAVININAVV